MSRTYRDSRPTVVEFSPLLLTKENLHKSLSVKAVRLGRRHKKVKTPLTLSPTKQSRHDEFVVWIRKSPRRKAHLTFRSTRRELKLETQRVLLDWYIQ